MKNFSKILFAILLFSSCANSPEKVSALKELQPGDICSIVNDSTSFGVLKILAIEDSIYHVKLYRNTFPQRPAQVNLPDLTVAPDTANLSFGIPHLAVTQKSFLHWKPEFILNEKISTEELAPYEKWKASQTIGK